MSSTDRIRRSVLAILLVAITSPSFAQDPAATTEKSGTAEKSEATQLTPELQPLAALLGNWEINATWSSGESLWARNEFSVTLGGKFVEARTFAKDGDGKVYHRYTTLYGWDPEQKQLVAHGFTYDGTVSQVVTRLQSADGGGKTLLSSWKPEPTEPVEIKQQVALPKDGKYQWQVWMKADDASDFEEIMNGTWYRK